ncbi:MAG: restriction endonuclease [Verrucomicrobiae bacterium]|nr:restriction endonuclease [Verrucomicrobiae bacterium]
MAKGGVQDEALGRVVDFFLRQNGFENQAADTLRRALDEVIDGMRTGRWAVDSLEKTEKSYIGTKVEILFKFDFELEDGEKLDTRIEGAEVDIKCTVLRDWMIPREAVGELCLLVRIDDARSKFWIGIVRTSPEVLRPGKNQDGKTSLSAAGKKHIRWIIEEGILPANLLATLDPKIRAQILDSGSGQKRINQLFRLVQRRVISRVDVETVARQKDPMKRVRDARLHLAKEGILIIGHQGDDPAKAKKYGLPVPIKGEFVSVWVGIEQPGGRGGPFLL